jgi:hypothetical protein
MRGGRGQITAFFLIGLAVLLVFIIILLLRSVILARSTPNPGSPGQEYDAALVKGYVESCLDLAADDGFAKLGRQGGLLFQSQGGLSPETGRLSLPVHAVDASGRATAEQVTLAFGLVNDSGFPFHPPFPVSNGTEYTYPFPGVSLANIGMRAQPWAGLQYDGAFGQYSLPPLCNLLGANNGSGSFRCPTLLFALPGQVSAQQSLESFIGVKVKGCIDPAELSSRLGAEVTMGQPNVTVTFTRGETLVSLDLPLRFTAEGGALRLSSFSRRYPARLEQLSWYVLNLIKRASKDPYFRLNDSANYSRVAGYDGFVVTQQNLSPAATLGQRRDLLLVTIADPGSRVGKSVWFFQFLLQARPPVLDRIDNVNLVTASSADVAFAALAPDGDEVIGNIAKYDDASRSWGTPSLPQLILGTDERTWHGTATLAKGMYNASVTSLSSGLSDWQIFRVS